MGTMHHEAFFIVRLTIAHGLFLLLLLLFCEGFASMTVPMYISEAAPVHVRGSLITLNNMFITGGQFIASVIDGLFANVPSGWR